MKKTPQTVKSPFNRILPETLSVGRDTLVLRLDFYKESIVMQESFDGGGSHKIVSAQDIASALSKELSFSSGILPENTLWWGNNPCGPYYALWMAPGVRRLALQTKASKPPERYNVPLPGLIFICRPANPPRVFAAARRPEGGHEKVYYAPFTNVYQDGRTCAGSNRYPQDVAGIPESFLTSFFTLDADIKNRSAKHPMDITRMWQELHEKGAQEYPLSDLYQHGTVKDLMEMKI